MNRNQFRSLADVFWKTAHAEQLQTSYEHYAKALRDVPPSALDSAIDRWHREGKKMPLPSDLRELASAGVARSTATPIRASEACAHCVATVDYGVRDGAMTRARIWHADDCPFPHCGPQFGEVPRANIRPARQLNAGVSP